MAANSEKLEQELKEVGNALLSPPCSVEQLIRLLERLKFCLSIVKQSQYASMQKALETSMKGLVHKELFGNKDADVRVYLASCLIEIARITEPNTPYDNVQMEGICRLIVPTFGNLSDTSHPLYHTKVSILERFAKLRLFQVMVDLNCYDLMVDMFKHFLNNIREYHSDTVYSSMGFIMILVLEESDEVPLELLSTLLEFVRKENKDVLPRAWKLAKRVIENCSSKIAPYMSQAVHHKGFPSEDYSKLVTFMCDHRDISSYGPDDLEIYEEDDMMELEGSKDFDEFDPEDAPSEKYDVCGANYLSDENYSANLYASKTVPQKNTPVGSATERKGNSSFMDVGVHFPCGSCPLDDRIGKDHNFSVQTGFSAWFEKGLKKKNHKQMFLEEDDIISPPLDLGVIDIRSKTWFLNLNYAGHSFDSDHIDVIFYCLRLKGMHSPDSIIVKFTTTDNLFDQTIQTLYSTFMKMKYDPSLVASNHIVADYITGYRMLCNTEWSYVDHVLFPIHIPGNVSPSKGGHWVLGRLSVKERCIFVYNSLRSGRNDKLVAKVVEAYAVLLPHFFKLLGFYQKRHDIDFNCSPYVGKDASDAFDIKMVDDLPTQEDNDCGLFVASFAEYFICGKDIPVSKFDVELHRSRLANLLWSYATRKQIEHVEGDEVR